MQRWRVKAVTDANGRAVLSAKRVTTSKTLLEFVLNRSDLGTLRGWATIRNDDSTGGKK